MADTMWIDHMDLDVFEYLTPFDRCHLLDLPLELTHEILKYLDKKSLARLQRCHPCLVAEIEPYLYSKLKLVKGCEESTKQLISITDNKKNLTALVSNLIIPIECLYDTRPDELGDVCQHSNLPKPFSEYCYNCARPGWKKYAYFASRESTWTMWANSVQAFLASASSTIKNVELQISAFEGYYLERADAWKELGMYKRFFKIVLPAISVPELSIDCFTVNSKDAYTEATEYWNCMPLVYYRKLNIIPQWKSLNEIKILYRDYHGDPESDGTYEGTNEYMSPRGPTTIFVNKLLEFNPSVTVLSTSFSTGLHLPPNPCTLTILKLENMKVWITDFCYAMHMSPHLTDLTIKDLVLDQRDPEESEDKLELVQPETFSARPVLPYSECCKYPESTDLVHLFTAIQSCEQLINFSFSFHAFHTNPHLRRRGVTTILYAGMYKYTELCFDVNARRLDISIDRYIKIVERDELKNMIREAMPSHVLRNRYWHDPMAQSDLIDVAGHVRSVKNAGRIYWPIQ